MVSKARLIITAVVLEGRPPAEVITEYGVSKSWLYELLASYKVEGDAAFEPRSKRPHTSPSAISDHTIGPVVALRKHLAESGLDAGPDTIAWHLHHRHQIDISIATISRTLNRLTAATRNCPETATKLPAGGHERCPVAAMRSARHDVVCLTASRG